MPKGKIASKVYVNADGSESAHASPDANSLEFRFADTPQTVLTLSLADVGPACTAAATFHGLSQKIGDAYAGADSVEQAIESAQAVIERLGVDDWVKARESAGPRVTILADAIKVCLEANGETVDDARYQSIRTEKLKTKEQREGALANPAVKAEYERIRTEKQKARQKIADSAAKDAGPADLSAF